MKNTLKSGIQKGFEESVKKASSKYGDYLAKKSGDKIVELLGKRNKETVKPIYDLVEKMKKY